MSVKEKVIKACKAIAENPEDNDLIIGYLQDLYFDLIPIVWDELQ
jgi:hypothetical protein